MPFDSAVQAIADLLVQHANQPDYEIDAADPLAQARREAAQVDTPHPGHRARRPDHETDALKSALRFVAQLDQRAVTSTASRLAVVQREIDNPGHPAPTPDPASRAALQRIAQAAARSTRAGHVEP